MRIQETGEFKDPSFWGGENGWCAAAMARVINLLPADRKSDKQKLITYNYEESKLSNQQEKLFAYRIGGIIDCFY